MTKSKKVREKIFELLMEGLSAEKIIDQLTKDPQWNKEDIPTPKTIRNWQNKSLIKNPLFTETEKELARQRDIRVFKESDKILNEGEVRFYTDQLQMSDWPFKPDVLHKMAKYFEYFSLYGNKYIDKKLCDLSDKFIKALDNAHDLAASNYFLEGDMLTFMPVGYQHYLNSTDEEQPEYKEIARQLSILAKQAYKAYISYREAVKNILFI